MIARIESFDVDEDDHALAGPEPADTLMAPSVPPAPAPPAPASASASAPVPEADVAHVPLRAQPRGPVPEADVAPSRPRFLSPMSRLWR